MEDCVILFLHHKKDKVTEHHLSMMISHNPKFKVIPLTPSSSPRSTLWSYNNMWMHNDTMIYDWMDSKDFIKSRRYCWFDWDTLCEQSVDEYYKEAWDAPMAGTNLITIKSNPNWQWFNHAKKNKELSIYWEKMHGISPFCGMIVSDEALEMSVQRLKSEHLLWKEQNNELRLSTCAHVCGIPLSTVPRDSVQAFASTGRKNGKIKHPVKIIGENGMKRVSEFKDVLIVSAAFSTTDEIVRDLNASRETYQGWDINFIGRGQIMESYIEAKVTSVLKFAELNEGMFEWLLVIDSNDTLVIKPFDAEVKKTLESFNKPIIFGGEANCYPLKEFEGLYSSNSKIKYLNSGCLAVHKDFVKPLFNNVLRLVKEHPQYAKIGYNPPGDQTYYTLCLFSKELGIHSAVDDKGKLSVSTALLPDSLFSIDKDLVFEGSRPYILHCQGNDKHARKRDFMRKLGIPVRG